MHPHRVPLILTLSLAILVPSAARAEQLYLEIEPGVTTLAYCDSAHLVGKCNMVHVETATGVTVGGSIRLDGKDYILDWMGPGYYLDSGVILQAEGGAAPRLAGQRWVEIYPERGKAHTSRAWRDADGDRLLSVADALTLEDGKVVQIKDVRLNLRVSPAPAQ